MPIKVKYYNSIAYIDGKKRVLKDTYKITVDDTDKDCIKYKYESTCKVLKERL